MFLQYEERSSRAQGCFLPSTFSQCEGRFSTGLRHSREGGNPALPRRMGPRIREDDKIVNPSFPRALFSKAPEPFSVRRGVLLRGVLRGAFGADGNPVLHLVNVPPWGNEQRITYPTN